MLQNVKFLVNKNELTRNKTSKGPPFNELMTSSESLKS